MAVISGGRNYKPGDWFIASEDGKMRVIFETEEKMTEVRTFMEYVCAGERRKGENYGANRFTGVREQLKDVIDECQTLIDAITET